MSWLPLAPWWVLFPLAALLLAAVAWPLHRRPEAPSPGRGALLRRSGILVLLLVAMLRPGLPGGDARATTAELDVFFVVDTTSSSVAEDYADGQPRLAGMKKDILDIANELAGARFSLLTFDRQASVKLPLTTDTGALETLVAILTQEVTAYSRGSSVTVANDVLVERLQAARQAHPDRPRVVFYLGDGEQTAAAAPQPFSIPGNLINGGAVLGYGTVQGGRMLENFGYSSAQKPQYIKDTTTAGGGDAVSRIDEHMLSTIAADLDVPYVHRSAGDPVTQALQDARPGTVQLSSQAAAGSRFELYWILALAAFPLLVWELLIHGRRIASLRPVPEAAR
ncbi:MAG: hypothetical protein JWO93_204 [Micrococcaceae bacterium]|nr:hypothetical protein [Micrococcaceae bacterium]